MLPESRMGGGSRIFPGSARKFPVGLFMKLTQLFDILGDSEMNRAEPKNFPVIFPVHGKLLVIGVR